MIVVSLWRFGHYHFL